MYGIGMGARKKDKNNFWMDDWQKRSLYLSKSLTTSMDWNMSVSVLPAVLFVLTVLSIPLQSIRTSIKTSRILYKSLNE